MSHQCSEEEGAWHLWSLPLVFVVADPFFAFDINVSAFVEIAGQHSLTLTRRRSRQGDVTLTFEPPAVYSWRIKCLAEDANLPSDLSPMFFLIARQLFVTKKDACVVE